jgi:hypothetical protein
LKLFLNIFTAPVLSVLCRPQANFSQARPTQDRLLGSVFYAVSLAG